MIISMSSCLSDENLAENMEERAIEDICELREHPGRYVISFGLKMTAYQFFEAINLLIWEEKIILNNSISEEEKQKDRDEF